MRVSFELDTDDIELAKAYEKIYELRTIEKMILSEARKIDYKRKESWLASLPDKPF